MDDDTTPGPPGGSPAGSGNRWEPATGRPTDETAPLAGRPALGPMPSAPPADATDATDPSGAAARPTWRDRLRPDRLGPRARTGVAAGAAALVVGGVGGFAIGHATADGGNGYGGFDGQGLGQRFDGHGPDGFPPQGRLPGQPGVQGRQGPLPSRPGGSTGELPDQQGTDS